MRRLTLHTHHRSVDPATAALLSALPSSRSERRRALLSTALALTPLVGAAAIWATTLQQVDVHEMSDLGLVSVLPARFFAALALLGAGFAFNLTRQQVRTPVLLLYTAMLIVIVYGTPRLIEEVPRFAVTWRHVGITDYITRNGSVDPQIDAYFNWPSFFILLSLLTEVAGVKSAVAFAGWAPVVFNALYLAPILGIVGWATRDRRLIWLTAWLFFSWNWIGQDYLSPQALAYFGYLVIVLVLLRWFTTEPGAATISGRIVAAARVARAARAAKRLLPEAARRRAGALLGSRRTWALHGEPRAEDSRPMQRVLLMGTLILIYAALVPSHQLTPFVVLMTVGSLVLLGRVDARRLPTLMAIIAGAWLSYAAVEYLGGHLRVLAGNLGDVQGSVGANVGNRVGGSSQHTLVVYGRLAFTGALWLMAVAGFFRRRARGRRDVALVLLATAPFIAVPTQPYGGEILLRVFLFTLPAMAFFAAAAVFPSARRAPALATTLATLALCVLPLGALMVTRYGNERGDAFTHAEVAAVDALYSIAPQGSLLLGTGNSTPWKWAHYEQYRYQLLPNRPEWRSEDLARDSSSRLRTIVEGILEQHEGRAFLLIMRSQQAEAVLLGTMPHDTIPRLERAVAASPRFVLRFRNRDARIYELVPAPGQGARS